MRPANPIYAKLGQTIFETMSRLAQERNAINLGQGFPDDRGPDDVRKAAADAVLDGWNQYPPMMGLPALRQSVAAHESRFYGLDVNWETEVMVTSGATEALAAAILALVEPGDEAILLQPAYDAYAPLVRRAGGTPVFVSLEPPEWRLDVDRIAKAFTERTKVLIFNTPQNPVGRVFTAEELDALARLVERHDAYVISDEVYEHVVFDGRRHLPLITRPGMRGRCVKIGSAGKTFSLTGWKVGLVVAAPELLRPVSRAHQFLTFTTPPNLQTAVAYGLGKTDAFFADIGRELQRRRDRLADGFRSIGWKPLPAEGGYFLTIDLEQLPAPHRRREEDSAFCKRLVEEAGVAAIPVSAFYESSPVRHLVRFCFVKQDAVLDEGLKRLRSYFG